MLIQNPRIRRSTAAPSGVRRPCRLAAAVVALVIIAAVWTASPAAAQVPQRYSVTIDASTTQPVGTGFLAPSSTGDVIIFAEGAVRGPTQPERFERGWFGPGGQDHYDGAGQPIVDGMPYGALVGGFSATLAQYQFMGRMGAFTLQPAHAGHELRLALNLSAADLAALDGQITVNVIYLPAGTTNVSKFVITRNTPLPLATGIFAAAGEQYVVLPRGRLHDPLLANSAYSDGHFGPEGLLGLVSPTQLYADGAYGALYGWYGIPNSPFHIGDGGCWSTEIADQGNELQLLINADAAAQSGMGGKFVVYVLRIPPPDPAGVTPAEELTGRSLRVTPNPIRGHADLRFRLERDDHVRLRVFDAEGRAVRQLADGDLAAGVHEVAWDAADDRGRRVPAGTYFYQVSTGAGTESGRLIVVN